MQTLSAQELTEQIRRARGGCMNALGDLLELYRSYLGLIARVQFQDTFQAKFSQSDVIQATFLQANKAFVHFAGNTEGELMAWLRKIFASQLATEIRRYSTRRRDATLERQIHLQVDQSSVMLAGMLVGRGGSPSQSAIRREHAVLLADALAKLPEDYREVIVLRHLQGTGFGEIADKMNRSIDSVKGIWRRAIRKLRELLGDRID